MEELKPIMRVFEGSSQHKSSWKDIEKRCFFHCLLFGLKLDMSVKQVALKGVRFADRLAEAYY